MELNDFQIEQLVSTGDCFLHHHSEDRRPNHDTLNALQAIENVVTKSTDYTATYSDDWIVCTATMTVTLPAPKGGKIFHVVNTGTGTVTTTVPTGYTINGTTTLSLAYQYYTQSFKPITSTGYIGFYG